VSHEFELAIDVAHSVVCLYVCLFMFCSHGCFLQKRAEQIEMPLGADSGRLKEPGIRWGQDPRWEGEVLGSCPAH